MAKATPKANNSTASQQRALLRSLSQQLCSEVFGVPTCWFRDNSHRVQRNDDGSYDAAQVAKVMRTEVRAADLADYQLEGLQQLAVDVSSGLEGSRKGAIRILTDIEQTEGIAGMAAVGQTLLETLRDYQAVFHSLDAERCPTEEEIRRRADREIAEIPRFGAWQDRRTVLLCPSCKKHRWGRKWLSKPIPADHLAREHYCPECDED